MKRKDVRTALGYMGMGVALAVATAIVATIATLLMAAIAGSALPEGIKAAAAFGHKPAMLFTLFLGTLSAGGFFVVGFVHLCFAIKRVGFDETSQQKS